MKTYNNLYQKLCSFDNLVSAFTKERKGNFKDKTQKEYDSERNKFFKEAKKIVARDPNFLRGQWDRYKNLFGDRITIEKFREMVEE